MKAKIQSKDGFKVVDLNRRKAGHAKCLNCRNWSPSEVTNCSQTDCHLHWLRTGEGKQDPKMREKSIRDYCLWCMNGQLSEVSKCTCRYCPLFAFRNTRLAKFVELPSSEEKGHIEVPAETVDTGLIPQVETQVAMDFDNAI